MAQNASLIHQGPMRIWAGITTPTTGTPPTLMTHTNGVPATGIELGYTEGDGLFEYLLTKLELTAEQNLAPVAVAPTVEMVKLTCLLQEANFTALKTAFDSGIGNVDDGSKTLFYSGGNVPTPMTTPIFFSSPRRDNSAKFFIGVIYLAYSTKGFAGNFGKLKKTNYPLELVGILDSSRNAGDELFQFFREK